MNLVAGALGVLALAAATFGTPAVGAAPAPPEGLAGIDITLTPVVDLDAPMAMVPRLGTQDLYVAERAGLVRRLIRSPDGLTFTVDPRVVLDLTSRTTTDNERGLLGLAPATAVPTRTTGSR